VPATLSLTPTREATDRSAPYLPIVDVLAPALLVMYFVLTFRPLELTLYFPGFASSGLFPLLSLGVLLLTPTDRLARIPIPWAILAYVAWLVASYAWTEIDFSTAFLIRSQLPPLLMLSVLTATIPPARVVKVLLGMFVALGVWSLLNSLAFSSSRVVHFSEGGIDGGDQVGFRGTFNHKNLLGVFMVYALCMVLPFARGRWRKAAILLCVALIMGTRSATAASGLFAVMFAWFWISAIQGQKRRREREVLFVLSIFSAVGAVVVAFGLLPSLLDLYQKDITFSGRTIIWSESLVTIGRRPIQGYGYGGVWLDGQNPVTAELRSRITFGAAHSHNGAIEVLLQVGVIGLGLLLVFIGRLFRLVGFAIVRRPLAPYGQWGLLTLLAILLMQISEPLFEGGHLGLLIVIWTVLTRLHNDELRPSWVRERRFATTY
jgi:O-antigen ligase